MPLSTEGHNRPEGARDNERLKNGGCAITLNDVQRDSPGGIRRMTETTGDERAGSRRNVLAHICRPTR